LSILTVCLPPRDIAFVINTPFDGGAPPPPGIATPRASPTVPAAVPPPVIIKIVIKIALDVVVYFKCLIVTKIIDVVPVVVPFRAVKSPGYIFVFPEIVDIAPVFAAVRA
jgi:hypothetical protein